MDVLFPHRTVSDVSGVQTEGGGNTRFDELHAVGSGRMVHTFSGDIGWSFIRAFAKVVEETLGPYWSYQLLFRLVGPLGTPSDGTSGTIVDTENEYLTVRHLCGFEKTRIRILFPLYLSLLGSDVRLSFSSNSELLFQLLADGRNELSFPYGLRWIRSCFCSSSSFLTFLYCTNTDLFLFLVFPRSSPLFLLFVLELEMDGIFLSAWFSLLRIYASSSLIIKWIYFFMIRFSLFSQLVCSDTWTQNRKSCDFTLEHQCLSDSFIETFAPLLALMARSVTHTRSVLFPRLGSNSEDAGIILCPFCFCFDYFSFCSFLHLFLLDDFQ